MKCPLPILTVRKVAARFAEGDSVLAGMWFGSQYVHARECQACIRFALLHPERLTPKRRKRRKVTLAEIVNDE